MKKGAQYGYRKNNRNKKLLIKKKSLKRALNILGVELTENEAVEIVEKVKPRKKFFGLFGTEPGTYEIL